MALNPPPRHVVVVGGGITGLAAALRICDSTDHDAIPTCVTLLEQSDRLGGKLRSATLEWDGGAQHIELGADSFLARTPAGMQLVERLGLKSELVHPGTGRAHIALPGGLRALPVDTVMGIPASPLALAEAGLVSAASVARMLAEPDEPGEPVVDDISVGTLIRRRLGDEVVDNVIDPLLGGIYAGDVDKLSLQATMPALAERLRDQPSLVRAAQAVCTARVGTGHTFATVRGGMDRFVSELERALHSSRSDAGPRVKVRCGSAVRRLRRTGEGWELTLGPATGGEALRADAVLLAAPARTAWRLLQETVPGAAAELAGIEYASVAVINIVLPDVALPSGSGVLIPSFAGRAVKAVTFVDQKWHRDARGVRLLRASVGRYGEEAQLWRANADLVELVLAELAEVLGPLPEPLAARVQRWGGALPQYLVGHTDRVSSAREQIAPLGGLALAGAGYDGVGVAASIASAYQAADELVARFSVVEKGEPR
jgi:oxygen-dependent protoporphyrinogen oxidase